MTLSSDIAANYIWLRRHARRMTHLPLDADDVLHAAVVRMLSSECRGPFRPWAKVVLRRTLIDMVRRATYAGTIGEHHHAPLEPWHATVPASGDAHIEMRELTDRVMQLPRWEFETFLAMRVMGHSPAAVCVSHGMPLGSVKSLTHRADGVVFSPESVPPDSRGVWKRSGAANVPVNVVALRRVMGEQRCGG